MSAAADDFSSLNPVSAITQKPLTAAPTTPLKRILAQLQAAPACHENHAPGQCPLEGSAHGFCPASQARCVIGVDHQQVVGILTRGDLLRYFARFEVAGGRPESCHPLDVTLGDVMTRPVITLAETALTDLSVAIDMLRHHRIQTLPIVDGEQHLTGLITCESLQHTLLTHQLHWANHQRLKITEIEQRYANLVDTAPVGIIHTDARGYYTYVNERWCNITGLQYHQAIQQHWQVLIHPDDLPLVTEEMTRAIEHQRPFQCEFRLQRPDCGPAWVYGQMVAERSPQGTVLGYVGTFTDITRHKQFEIVLQKSDAQSRNILSLIPDYLFRIDSRGRYRDIVTYRDNISLVSAGVNPVGQTMKEVLPEQVADWQMTYLYRALATNELGVYEQPVTLGDRTRWEEVRVIKSGPDEALFMVRDISDRKQAELALQALIEGTAAVTGEDFFPSLVRHIAGALGVDYALVSEIKGEELHTLACWGHNTLRPPFHYRFADTPCGQAVKKGVFYGENQVQHHFPLDTDLVAMDVECYLGVTLQDAGGTPIGVLCVLNSAPIADAHQAQNLLRVFASRAAAELERQRATTSLQRLNQQLEAKVSERTKALQRTNAELARATRLKDEFLANMSHELRTPLNAILGLAEALQEGTFGDLNDTQAKTLDTIETSGQHLLVLINDILDVAKIEAGKMDLQYQPTDIAELCRSSCKFVSQDAFKKTIRLETRLSPTLPHLMVDERRLRQVLINLFSNAVKFTPAGGQVTVTARYHGADRSENPCPGLAAPWVEIAVSDTGIGISPDKQERLFQPFVQVDTALNREYKGTGLGLALVKRIVELHGGRVSVASQPGQGSCFTLKLPCSDLGQKLLPPQTGTAPALGQITTTPALILIAEDNEANITTISGYLKARAYSVLLAHNGHEAVDLAAAEVPDIILMDIQMPGMDGLEAIQNIRQIPQLATVPILAITALTQASDHQRCLAAGANQCLVKPLKLKHLVSTIEELLVPPGESIASDATSRHL